MIKILFICHGNICRSPMGEYILKDMVKKRGLEDEFFIASAAVSTEEIGNPVYPQALAELKRHGIDCHGHRARQVLPSDYDDFDIIIGMEERHIRVMLQRFFGEDKENKLRTCMSFAGRPNENVDDPWYTGRFEEVYYQIYEACEGLLTEVMSK